MLPFTKRPGRDDDKDVITKDDLVQSPMNEGGGIASDAKRSILPASTASVRPPADSVGEDEMTNVLPARSFNGMLAPLPAAGRPATVPPRSRPAVVRVGPPSARPSPLSADDDTDDDDEGRTVVRGAPKIVKRSSKNLGPQASTTSLSPAAVIKATLESARANRRDSLMPGPPSDLLEDRTEARRDPVVAAALQDVNHRVDSFAARGAHTNAFEGMPSHQAPASFAPPSSRAGGYGAHQGSGAPDYSGAYGASSGPPSSMPAHFMSPQYSDPPATAVTSGHRTRGRPTASWAVALLGCGLCVGVAAIALLQGGDTATDTTASFVDPSIATPKNGQGRAPGAQPAHLQAPAHQPQQVQMPQAQQPAASQPTTASLPPTVQPFAAAPEAMAGQAAPSSVVPVVPAAPPAATAPTGVAFAPVAVVPAAPAATPAAPAPKPASVAAARPAPAWKPAPKPTPKPAPVAAAEDESAKKASSSASAKKGGKATSDTDDETKKALEALQRAQLESANSFGDD